MDLKFIDHIAEALQRELPGPEAQFRMAHLARRPKVEPPPDVRLASVLALFYPHRKAWHLVLIERVANANDRHSGQISFPGGRHDASDESLEFTALREAEEEVGARADTISVLGRLTNLFIPVSNYLVHPFVGFTGSRPDFSPEQKEVQGILEVPFEDFLNREKIGRKNLRISDHIELQGVPHFNIQGKTVWGATAMMLSELLAVTHPDYQL